MLRNRVKQLSAPKTPNDEASDFSDSQRDKVVQDTESKLVQSVRLDGAAKDTGLCKAKEKSKDIAINKEPQGKKSKPLKNVRDLLDSESANEGDSASAIGEESAIGNSKKQDRAGARKPDNSSALS